MKYAVLLLFVSFAYYSSAQTEINLEVLNIPVLITGETSSGSGFFYQDSLDLYLVTAKHVILQPDIDNKGITFKSKEFAVQYYDQDSDTSTFNGLVLDIEDYLNNQQLLFNDNDDVIVIPIGTYTPNPPYKITFNNSIPRTTEIKVFKPRPLNTNYIRKFSEVTLGNDIFLFGYPKSLGLIKSTDYDFNIPLLRKGTLAGKNLITKKLIIDCPSYGGNSGGPVFNYKRRQSNFDLIGIVVSFIPYTEIWENRAYGIKNYELDNSGYSIVEPIDKVIELIKSK